MKIVRDENEATQIRLLFLLFNFSLIQKETSRDVKTREEAVRFISYRAHHPMGLISILR